MDFKPKLLMDGVEVPAAWLALDLPVPPPTYDEVALRFRDSCGRFVPALEALRISGPSFVEIGLGAPFPVDSGDKARMDVVVGGESFSFDAIVMSESTRKIKLRLIGGVSVRAT